MRDPLELCEHRLPDNGADRKSTRLNSSHVEISYAVFCLKKNIAESVLLRVDKMISMKCEEARKDEIAIVKKYFYDMADKINKSAKDAINAFAGGDEAKMMFMFFHGSATTEIYTLSLHDALPI